MINIYLSAEIGELLKNIQYDGQIIAISLGNKNVDITLEATEVKCTYATRRMKQLCNKSKSLGWVWDLTH